MTQIQTTHAVVRQLIEQAVGLTHVPGPEERSPAVINEPAPADDTPITPVDSQLDHSLTSGVPVDDEDYVPTNVVELGRAAMALSREVPPETIVDFYKEIKKLAIKYKEGQKKHDEPPKQASKEIDVDKIHEMRVRTTIRKMLREADHDAGEGWQGARGTKKKGSREETLDDVAKAVGLAGASGARQLINTAAQRVKFLIDMDPDERDEIVVRAAGDYIQFLLDEDEEAPGEGLTPDDAKFLRDHPEHVMQLDGFREFLKKYWNAAMRKAGVKDTPPPNVADISPSKSERQESPKPKKSAAEIEADRAAKADRRALKSIR